MRRSQLCIVLGHKIALQTLHQLERPDRLFELFPIVDVLNGIIKGGLHETGYLRHRETK